MIDRLRPANHRRAFSLIELMIVILIIALVISIAIPSLSGARNSSRNAGARALLNQITQSAAQFERDERRMPGYFDARAMGHTENETRGFTTMHNIMLDLAGGIVTTAGSPEVGPMATQTVLVDPKMIGTEAGGKMYFVPDRKFFLPQDEANQMATTVAAHQSLPSVVDPFMNPVLAWMQNETATGPVSQANHFARAATPTSANDPQARFYWNANAGFLNATATGRRSANQRDATHGSLLGGQMSVQNRELSLIGVLGHPSFPARATGQTTPPALPASARGALVVHSAGTDGIYFSQTDKGARQFDLAARPYIDYRVNFAPDPTAAVGAANNYTDRDGKVVNVDITAKFDDLLAVGGN